jgi:hypothetical protein
MKSKYLWCIFVFFQLIRSVFRECRKSGEVIWDSHFTFCFALYFLLLCKLTLGEQKPAFIYPVNIITRSSHCRGDGGDFRFFFPRGARAGSGKNENCEKSAGFFLVLPPINFPLGKEGRERRGGRDRFRSVFVISLIIPTKYKKQKK